MAPMDQGIITETIIFGHAIGTNTDRGNATRGGKMEGITVSPREGKKDIDSS